MRHRQSRRRAPNRFGIGRGLDAIGWWAFGLIAVAALAIAVGFGWGAMGRWRLARRVATEYVQAACVVLESRVGTEPRSHAHGVTGRRPLHATAVYKAAVRYRYQVAGEFFVSDRFSPRVSTYDTAEMAGAIVDRYPAGKACTCWYDPARPEESFLEK
jgi:hypothetical protein